MRYWRRLLMCFAAAIVWCSACVSTTLVASDDRPAATTNDQSAAIDAGSGELDQTARDADPLTPRQQAEANGFGLGGREQLEGLLTDCEAGNDLACDILYQVSGFDSPYEAAALACGGRTETRRLFCTAGIDASPDGIVFDTASPGLADIVAACEADADMTACDFLYFRSPLASEAEQIGATCGGRVNVAVPDCRTFLAP